MSSQVTREVRLLRRHTSERQRTAANMAPDAAFSPPAARPVAKEEVDVP